MRAQTEHLKTLVLAYLEANSLGHQQGASKEALMEALHIHSSQEKRLREALAALAEHHPIGSSAEHGYFICVSERCFDIAAGTIRQGHLTPSQARLERIERQRRLYRARKMGLQPTLQLGLGLEVPA